MLLLVLLRRIGAKDAQNKADGERLLRGAEDEMSGRQALYRGGGRESSVVGLFPKP